MGGRGEGGDAVGRVEGRGVAMGAVVGGGRGDEHDSGAGCRGCVCSTGKVAGEGDGGEDELSPALCNEAGVTRPGVCRAELDHGEVAIELLPGV